MARAKSDAVLAAAVEPARRELLEATKGEGVGEHVGFTLDGERLGTHWFAATLPGYGGWAWAVTVTRAPRAKTATVCETQLLPGDDAILSPEWLPWADRLAPGDVGPGDVTPKIDDDPNLEPGFEATGDEDVDAVALWELGLGRPRVLSAEGRARAALRWYDGAHGPNAEVATKAPARCAGCGYFIPMAGALRSVFGVCANEWSPSDGGVVSRDHGCGAHSEIDMDAPEPEKVGEPILDDEVLEVL
ncbi:DUF3027 domain-containing protein [Janibacter sp. FSL W8-0316]|uniref:DUF3027 domain-containing protein n=1 Tax=Janibacter indicus TaxID=857417 RepID=A0A1L3MDM3_9MICO|nr:DUF3027 domain-containing protein [Janibacter indicus]APH00443.1 hypothetical protein ASJ30_01945 [Janibacter indicus]